MKQEELDDLLIRRAEAEQKERTAHDELLLATFARKQMDYEVALATRTDPPKIKVTVRDGEILEVVVRGLDEVAAATAGVGSSRLAALDRMVAD